MSFLKLLTTVTTFIVFDDNQGRFVLYVLWSLYRIIDREFEVLLVNFGTFLVDKYERSHFFWGEVFET